MSYIVHTRIYVGKCEVVDGDQHSLLMDNGLRYIFSEGERDKFFDYLEDWIELPYVNGKAVTKKYKNFKFMDIRS